MSVYGAVFAVLVAILVAARIRRGSWGAPSVAAEPLTDDEKEVRNTFLQRNAVRIFAFVGLLGWAAWTIAVMVIDAIRAPN